MHVWENPDEMLCFGKKSFKHTPEYIRVRENSLKLITSKLLKVQTSSIFDIC